MCKYDVFLSKNTKDLKQAEKISSLLKSYGLKVFESSEELRALGRADYAQAIDSALDNSEHIIVVCSDNEHGTGIGNDSMWVYYEWSSFRNELLSKRKTGNMVVVLCGQTDVASLAYGLRKYEAIHINDINCDGFINYFTKNRVSKLVNESEFDSDNIMYLKAFDFGLHLSQNIFAKQQGKEDLYDLREDYENFSNISIGELAAYTSDPDGLVKLLSDYYGDRVAKYFQFGQRTGLLSIVSLFIRKGAVLSDEQKDVFFSPFIKEGRSLFLPDKTLMNCVNLASDAKSDAQIVNCYKVIRHAITISTFKNCELCGQKVSSDATECPNCYTPL